MRAFDAEEDSPAMREVAQALANRDAHPDFRAHLQGRLAYVEQVNPARGARLRGVFEAIRWE